MSAPNQSRSIKVLAISSGGGHWVQLNRLRPAFDGCDLTFATVKESYRTQIKDAKFTVIPDANRSTKLQLLKSAYSIFRTIWKIKPDVVISTGAAPGYFAIRIGNLFKAKTIWVDSIANAETLSLSGQKAGKHADLWLTQWPDLAKEGGPQYAGNVL